MPWNVFYSYSHMDESLRDQLATYLAPLRQKKLIDEWHDRKIQPGADWNSEINSRIESADLAIMLLSPDFWPRNIASGSKWKRRLPARKATTCGLPRS